jgi:hypothetical protein
MARCLLSDWRLMGMPSHSSFRVWPLCADSLSAAIAGSARATTSPSIYCPAQAVLGCVENVLVRVEEASCRVSLAVADLSNIFIQGYLERVKKA